MIHFKNINNTDISILIDCLDIIDKGDWEAAHNIVQSKEGNPSYDRIHALLHRMEGDRFNTRYWYNLLGIDVPTISTKEETAQLKAFLTDLKNKKLN